jgi:heme exporter protein D
MSSLGPHATFIIASYVAAALIAIVVLTWVWLDYRAQQRRLADLEKQGVTRRSARQSTGKDQP